MEKSTNTISLGKKVLLLTCAQRPGNTLSGKDKEKLIAREAVSRERDGFTVRNMFAVPAQTRISAATAWYPWGR